MTNRRIWGRWLGLLAGVLWASVIGYSNTERAQGATAPANSPESSALPDGLLAQIAPGIREGVRAVVDKPTLVVHGPVEVFRCQPLMYYWFLEHPDQTVLIWRRLGAKCTDIADLGSGRFGWTDGKGSSIHWDTVFRNSHLRIWFAEGQARPGPLLGATPVHAVVVLHYMEGQDGAGRTLVRHQADLFLQTDSKTIALAARLFGAPANRLGEQGLAQLEMFFSALAWYLDRHPERAEALLLGKVSAPPSSGLGLHGN